LNVIVEDFNNDLGVAASLSKILLWVGKKINNEDYLTLGREILERQEILNKDEDGYATEEKFYQYRLLIKNYQFKRILKVFMVDLQKSMINLVSCQSVHTINAIKIGKKFKLF